MLCRTLGYKSLYEMYDSMDAFEYDLWMREWIREPWGDKRIDINQALQTSHLVNINLPREKQVSIERFLPFRPKQVQSDEDAFAWLQQMKSTSSQ